MVPRSTRPPNILSYYQLYLADGDSARFVRDVALQYQVATLLRLTQSMEPAARRAATLALGILGDRGSIAAIGRLLSDDDRAVRMIADDSSKAIWARTTSPQGRTLLDTIVSELAAQEYSSALHFAEKLVATHPNLPEAFCQRALAHYAMGNIEAAIEDCDRAVEINPFEYMALVGLGQCYLELERPRIALDYFRKAIAVHPDLEPVCMQIRKLEESLREIF